VILKGLGLARLRRGAISITCNVYQYGRYGQPDFGLGYSPKNFILSYQVA
jgi:hypothetical protein